MDIQEMLYQAITAVKSGQKTEARKLLGQILQIDPYHERAWLWLSSVVEIDEQKAECLKKVLSINPDNTAASKGLLKLEKRLNVAEPTVTSSVKNNHMPSHFQHNKNCIFGPSGPNRFILLLNPTPMEIPIEPHSEIDTPNFKSVSSSESHKVNNYVRQNKGMLVPTIEKIREAKVQVKNCQSVADEYKPGCLAFFLLDQYMSLRNEIRTLSGMIDELLLLYQNRIGFIQNQLGLEEKLTVLDATYSDRLVNAFLSSTPLVLNLPTSHNPEIIQIVQRITDKIEHYDKQISEKLLQHNMQVRNLRSYYFDYFSDDIKSLEYVLPKEFDF